jgi:hypothetical protein
MIQLHGANSDGSASETSLSHFSLNTRTAGFIFYPTAAHFNDVNTNVHIIANIFSAVHDDMSLFKKSHNTYFKQFPDCFSSYYCRW